MTLSFKHPFVSGVPDNPSDVAAGNVVPSNWNTEHQVIMSSGYLLGRSSAGDGPVELLPQSAFIGGGGGGGTSDKIDLKAAYGFVADGYLPSTQATDNANAFLDMMGRKNPPGGSVPGIKIISPVYGTPIPVIIDTSTSTVRTFADAARTIPAAHMLRAHDPVVFFTGTGGTLPTTTPSGAITGMMPVFSGFGVDMLANSFKVTVIDPFALFCDPNGSIGGPQPPAITFGGSPNNVYMATVNADWVNFFVPAGSYYSTQTFRWAGMRRSRLYCAGVTVVGTKSDGTPSGGAVFLGHGGIGLTGGFYPYAGYPINSVTAGSFTFQLKNVADAVNIPVGGWVYIGALDVMNTFGVRQSTPLACGINEYRPVRAVDLNTGIVTLGFTSGYPDYLRNSYLDNYPQYLSAESSNYVPIGPAHVYVMPPAWDTEFEVYDLSTYYSYQTGLCGRYAKIINAQIKGQAIVASQMDHVHFVNTNSGAIGYSPEAESAILFDKAVMLAEVEGAQQINTTQSEGSGPEQLIFRRCQGAGIGGTGKNTIIEGCDFGQITLGPLFCGGAAETVVLTGANRIGNIQISNRLDIAPPLSFGAMLNNWSFNNGILTAPLASDINLATNSWMLPGKSGYINDMAQQFPGPMGAFFQIKAVAAGQAAINTSATVGGVSGSASVHWVGNPITNGDIILLKGPGPVPSGLMRFYPYYAVQKTVDDFKLSLYLNGDPVPVTATPVTCTVIQKPNVNITTTLSSLPAGASVSNNATISIASPSVFNWGTTAPVANTPTVLQTDGVLPATNTVRVTAQTWSISGNVLTLGGTSTGGVFTPSGTFSGGIPFYPLNVVGASVPDGLQITGPKGASNGVAGDYFINVTQASISGVGNVTLNDPLSKTAIYIVTNPSGNQFNLSGDNGATNVNIVKNGSGTHKVITNPLKFAPNMCPSLTVMGSTGHPYVMDARNAPQQGRPFQTFGSRTMEGQMPLSPSNLSNTIQAYGNLKQMIVNVVKADTSGGGTRTLVISAKGFVNSTLAVSNFSATINLATTGVRVISPGAPVGSQSGDSLPSYGDSIAQGIQFVTTVGGGGQNSIAYAHVYVSVETDMGIFTTPAVGWYNDPNYTTGVPITQIDTTSPGFQTSTGL